MLKVKKMVAMVTEIAIYLHFTRKKQYIGIETWRYIYTKNHIG
jgi:hypothetical protein